MQPFNQKKQRWTNAGQWTGYNTAVVNVAWLTMLIEVQAASKPIAISAASCKLTSELLSGPLQATHVKGMRYTMTSRAHVYRETYGVVFLISIENCCIIMMVLYNISKEAAAKRVDWPTLAPKICKPNTVAPSGNIQQHNTHTDTHLCIHTHVLFLVQFYTVAC